MSRFRHVNQYDVLVQRWADIVGADRVAVLVADSAHPDSLFRNYESLVGITPGLLQPERVNRSFTRPEAELIRSFNMRNDLVHSDPGLFQRWLRTGAFRALVENRVPEPGESKVQLPPWALTRAREIQAEVIAGIEESGVAIFGDTATLTGAAQISAPATQASATEAESATRTSHDALPEPDSTPQLDQSVYNAIAAELLVGLLDSAQETRSQLAATVAKTKQQRNKARAKAKRRRGPQSQGATRSLSSLAAGARRRLPGKSRTSEPTA